DGPTARTDDGPFLSLPARTMPRASLWWLGALASASLRTLRVSGSAFGRFDSMHAHLFFLGAAFLLMEVHAINRLALLFGTTWIVSAVAIAIVLILIACANLTVIAFRQVPYALAYAGLAVSLLAAWRADP